MKPIKIVQMGGRALVRLDDDTATDTAVTPANASASVSIQSDGLVTYVALSAPAQYAWLLQGAAADYQLVVVVNSGVLTTGAAGTYALNISRSFGRNRTSDLEGTDTVDMTMTIEKISNPGVALVTANIILTANVIL